MRFIVYVGTRDAVQDARWCYVPTDFVAADRQQQYRSRRLLSEVQCWQLSQAIRKRLETVCGRAAPTYGGRIYKPIYHVYKSFLIQSLISNACHSLYRVTRGFNILRQIMVTFLSYISNACHSLSGVAERLQHTEGKPSITLLLPNIHPFPSLSLVQHTRFIDKMNKPLLTYLQHLCPPVACSEVTAHAPTSVNSHHYCRPWQTMVAPLSFNDAFHSCQSGERLQHTEGCDVVCLPNHGHLQLYQQLMSHFVTVAERIQHTRCANDGGGLRSEGRLQRGSNERKCRRDQNSPRARDLYENAGR